MYDCPESGAESTRRGQLNENFQYKKVCGEGLKRDRVIDNRVDDKLKTSRVDQQVTTKPFSTGD